MSSARMREKTRNLFRHCIHEALARPEQLTVSEWAAKYRELNESSSLRGRWNNEVSDIIQYARICALIPQLIDN